MELIAKLVKKLPQEVGQGKNGQWIKGAFVVETEGEFPKKVCFTVWGENMIKALDSIKEDDQIKVHFSVESREYNERWYTDLKAYRIDSLMSVAPKQVEVPEHEDIIPFGSPEDLPF